ncbi:hypothetical protein [Halioglobus sp. HI00S01]|nr:hypothetical protein [Halioglobus sp. HI00S01]
MTLNTFTIKPLLCNSSRPLLNSCDTLLGMTVFGGTIMAATVGIKIHF